MQETIGYVLAQVCKAHRSAANTLLIEAGLHAGQEMLLVQLWDAEGLTQSELAERLCVEAPTVTRMLQRMESADLIVRRPDPDDARVSRVYPSAQARALRPRVEAAWSELEVRTLATFTLEERVLLRRLLLQVLDNLAP